jgi:hypothetical protein
MRVKTDNTVKDTWKLQRVVSVGFPHLRKGFGAVLRDFHATPMSAFTWFFLLSELCENW